MGLIFPYWYNFDDVKMTSLYFFLQTSFNAVIPERNFLSSSPSMRFLTISQILLEVIKSLNRPSLGAMLHLEMIGTVIMKN